MAVQFYFDNLDPTTFQRLINVLLTSRFGEAVRLLPLRGADGGRDAETAPAPVLFEVVVDKSPFLLADTRLKPGRYIFQVKHHRTTEQPGTIVRASVVSDFEKELGSRIATPDDGEPVNYFFLLTNVTSSKEAISKVDEKRKELLGKRADIHADVLWQEHVVSWLDQTPRAWNSFPELFPGMIVPVLGQVAGGSSNALPRSVRIAVEAQSKRDGVIRFRQINLEQRLSKLFVDLDVFAPTLARTVIQSVMRSTQSRSQSHVSHYYWSSDEGVSCVGVLTSESVAGPQRLILEGGPGQGKSTISQMLAQLYRSKLLNTEQEYRNIWDEVAKARFPFRVELRAFAEWLGGKDSSVEQFLAEAFAKDAGGGNITVESLHTIVENQPVLLIFDGLDEVGNDDLRDLVIAKILDCLNRFESDLKADLKVVLTTRPPAIAGRIDKLSGFVRAQILPLNGSKVDEFVQRWTEVQCDDPFEREHVSSSFEKRKTERHVRALVKNPMQLSVLLHFIRLKGEAFPDRRAELYREYFKTVIDRDVEKSPELRRHRDEIETLHEVLGFETHSRAESDLAAADLAHDDLLDIVRKWLVSQGRKAELADELFRLGEERLGLIMVLKGEGAQARYGFDVQPIREYFTAAFINDKCEQNAHDLFQLMVPRAFWHEVALFLAGLRRANEKADLLSRARALDDEIESGWRSAGRAVTLQLLQEGVLTSPGHVQREALFFLLEILNLKPGSAKAEPRGLISTLPDLLASCDSDQPRASLQKILADALTRDDRHAIWRVFKVAARVIPSRELQKLIAEFTSTKEDLEPFLKVLWPAQAGLDFSALLDEGKNFKQNPTRSWAKRWFQAALLQPKLTGSDGAELYHELLMEQFAFQPLFRTRHAEKTECLRPVRQYAVWQLCEGVQSLSLALMTRERIPAPVAAPDFSGLSEGTRSYLEPLVSAVIEAVQRLNVREPITISLRTLVAVLDGMLSLDGLPAWIASRCAVTLMHYAESPQAIRAEGGLFYTTQRPGRLSHIEEWRKLRRNLTPFFRAAIPYDLDSAGKTFAARILQGDLQMVCPSHIKVSGRFESVPALIARKWLEGERTEVDWLDRVPFPRYWIPELMKADPTLLSLALLTRRPLEWFGPSVSLDIASMKNLLTVIGRSDDPALAAGALIASLGSKCWNIAKVATIGKMLAADANFADFGARLFKPLDRPGPRPLRIKQVAEAVVRGRFKTSLSTSTAAANFLAENSALKLPTLRSLGAF